MTSVASARIVSTTVKVALVCMRSWCSSRSIASLAEFERRARVRIRMRSCVDIQPSARVSRGSDRHDQTFQWVRMRTISLFSFSSLGLRSPAFQTAFRPGYFRSGVSSLDSMRKLCNLTTFLYRSDKVMSTCRRGSGDVRQKLF